MSLDYLFNYFFHAPSGEAGINYLFEYIHSTSMEIENDSNAFAIIKPAIPSPSPSQDPIMV